VLGVGARPPAVFFSILRCAFEVYSKVRIAKSHHFLASFILRADNLLPLSPQYSNSHSLDSVVKKRKILPQGAQGFTEVGILLRVLSPWLRPGTSLIYVYT